MGYLYLSMAIVAEVVGTSALKASQGFGKPLPGILAIGAYGVSFYLLSVVLKTIPVGVAYAIWSGAGISLIVIIGAIAFKQIPDIASIIGISMIMAGVMVINVFSTYASH
jgi:small multidrug resistance pump